MSDFKNNHDPDPFLAVGSQLLTLPTLIDRLHDALNNRLQYRGDQVFHEIAENKLRDAQKDFHRLNETIQAALAHSLNKKRVRLEIEDKETKCRSCCGCFSM